MSHTVRQLPSNHLWEEIELDEKQIGFQCPVCAAIFIQDKVDGCVRYEEGDGRCYTKKKEIE